MERVPLPKIIYNTLEDVLEAQIRRLVGDIAQSLSVDPKPLMQSIMKEKVSCYIFEESVEDYDLHTARCKSYELVVYNNNHLYIICKKPIVYTKEYCVDHLKNHVAAPNTENVLDTLVVEDKKYYVDKFKKVYSLDFKKIGLYFPEHEKVLIFKESTTPVVAS
jgi:hypothetical protein